jgi:hypothetical protein
MVGSRNSRLVPGVEWQKDCRVERELREIGSGIPVLMDGFLRLGPRPACLVEPGLSFWNITFVSSFSL